MEHRSWTARAMASLAAIALVVTACGGDDDADTTAPTGAAATPATSGDADAAVDDATDSTGGTAATTDDTGGDSAVELDPTASISFALAFGHNSFDPHRSPAAAGDYIWMRPVYDGLLRLVNVDGKVDIAPMLATSYEVADDGLSLELELRDDVVFQDGTPFDAEAVKANIERAKDAESTVSSLIDSIERVEVVDSTHVVLHLTEPDPTVPFVLASASPGLMVSPAAFGTDLSTEPVGSGPFELVSATKDADVVYARWDEHWDPDAAGAAEVTFTTSFDNTQRYNGVRSGQYDAAWLAAPLDSESRALVEEGYSWINVLSPISFGLLLNTDVAPLDDVRVRRAISAALDRSAFAAVTEDINLPTWQVFNEGYLGHNPDLADPYDPDAARALIREAGAEGATIEILVQVQAPQETFGLIIQEALSEIGLDVEISPISPTEARATWREGGNQAMVAPILAGADPSETLQSSYLAGDGVGTPAPELVQLAEAARVMKPGSPEREAAYQEIAAYMAENPIHIPIAQFSTVILGRPDVAFSDNMVVQQIGQLDVRGVGVAGE